MASRLGQYVLVGAAAPAEGSTGVTYAAGISATSAGATGLCLQLASLAPGQEEITALPRLDDLPHMRSARST